MFSHFGGETVFLDKHSMAPYHAPMARYRSIKNPDALQQRLKQLVREIHDEADPHEMNEYKRFVKQNVSVFSRAYFTAYLVRQFLDDGQNSPPPRRTRGATPPREDHEETAEGQSTLFVSIGKNRRVYPKDIIGLFTAGDHVSGDQIGQIKILDSYSFVDVDSTVADTLIAHFDGTDFRGRKLKVNYARSKKGD